MTVDFVVDRDAGLVADLAEGRTDADFVALVRMRLDSVALITRSARVEETLDADWVLCADLTYKYAPVKCNQGHKIRVYI